MSAIIDCVSVADPWHFGADPDPDPAICASDAQDRFCGFCFFFWNMPIVQAWAECVDNSMAQLEHQRTRILNLELMLGRANHSICGITASPKFPLTWTSPSPPPSLTEAKAPPPFFGITQSPPLHPSLPLLPAVLVFRRNGKPYIFLNILVRVGGDVQTPIAGCSLSPPTSSSRLFRRPLIRVFFSRSSWSYSHLSLPPPQAVVPLRTN